MTAAIAMNYDAQAALEQRMLTQGVERYVDINARASNDGDLTRDQGAMFNEAFGRVVTSINMEHLEQSLKKGRPATHAEAMKVVPHDLLAAIALKRCFHGAANERPLSALILDIGYEIAVAVSVERLKEKDEAKFKEIHRTTGKTQHSREKAAEAFLATSDEYIDEEGHELLGAKFLELVMRSVDIFHANGGAAANDAGESEFDEQGYRTLQFTEEAAAILAETKEHQQWMNPVYQAMVVCPVPWETFTTGAYLDERVARTAPLMRTSNRAIKRAVDAAVRENRPFVQALNAIQEVPLSINKVVLEALEYCNDNQLAVGKVPGMKRVVAKDADKREKAKAIKDNRKLNSQRQTVARDIHEAKVYAQYDRFYQPHYLDTRGRVYAKPGFNHQRADYCKALYNLADGEKVTERGLWWLKWNVATTCAKKINGKALDKMPHDKRVEWVDQNIGQILAIAEDPKGTVDLWKEADSPFCFLAACDALAGALKDPEYICRLPIAIDGSCSGIQHFSAMMRDAEGGALVNLIPGAEPQDVYRAVSEIVAPLVDADCNSDDPDVAEMARKWKAYGIDRSVCKRATMTYGYGSSQSGFSDQLIEDIIDKPGKGREIFGTEWAEQSKASRYLAKHIYFAICQTVKGAAQVMGFVQDIAGIMARENLPLNWTTPMGLPVIHAYYKPNFRQITTTLWNRALNIPSRYDPKVVVGHSDKLDGVKQRNASAPNFIHSLDAAHLQSVVLASKEAGINGFLLIHDSFAALPSQMDRFARIVRQTMVDMYENNDPLKQLHDNAIEAMKAKVASGAVSDQKALKKLEKNLKELVNLPMPVRGTLDLNRILESEYAFA